jgi:hypothetical protein
MSFSLQDDIAARHAETLARTRPPLCVRSILHGTRTHDTRQSSTLSPRALCPSAAAPASPAARRGTRAAYRPPHLRC